VPGWLRELASAAADLEISPVLVPPATGGRASAVLVLFRDGPGGPALLLIRRAAGLRWHASQPAFPGGAVDDGDAGPAATALREAAEEVGLDPAGVDVLAVLPEAYIPPSRFRVVPVLAWWRQPGAVAPADPAEVEAVDWVSAAELADPAARLMAHGPPGFALPAFRVRGMLIWGFTAALIDRLLALAGWEQPWDASVIIDP
jgi:8-oxo-dGTP pyrophosphatase MutT (NUDIX family)